LHILADMLSPRILFYHKNGPGGKNRQLFDIKKNVSAGL